jgi:hypothetical protein
MNLFESFEIKHLGFLHIEGLEEMLILKSP